MRASRNRPYSKSRRRQNRSARIEEMAAEIAKGNAATPGFSPVEAGRFTYHRFEWSAEANTLESLKDPEKFEKEQQVIYDIIKRPGNDRP
jgi:hypothetical protein